MTPDPADFVAQIDNPYLPFPRGAKWGTPSTGTPRTPEGRCGTWARTRRSTKAERSSARRDRGKREWTGRSRASSCPRDGQVGLSYRQEYCAGEAEDAAEILSLVEQAQVPFGHFRDVLLTEETTRLHRRALEYKLCAQGVGVVLALSVSGGSDREELVRFTSPSIWPPRERSTCGPGPQREGGGVLLIGACTGSGGQATVSASHRAREIPQPVVPHVAVVPESQRVDLHVPTFSHPTEVTNPLFPVSKQASVLFVRHVDGKPFRTEVSSFPTPGSCSGRASGSRRSSPSTWPISAGGSRRSRTTWAQADDGSVWYFGEDVVGHGPEHPAGKAADRIGGRGMGQSHPIGEAAPRRPGWAQGRELTAASRPLSASVRRTPPGTFQDPRSGRLGDSLESVVLVGRRRRTTASARRLRRGDP